ncbi:RDD family protein [Corynebacterium variabile]|uniref:RDD family protein n=1 Tax=Corynebacterium variabile TaxID=1727 RepID=UPI003A8CF7DC
MTMSTQFNGTPGAGNPFQAQADPAAQPTPSGNPYAEVPGVPAAGTAPTAGRRIGAVLIDTGILGVAALILSALTSLICNQIFITDLPTDMDSLNTYSWDEISALSDQRDQEIITATLVTVILSFIEGFVLVNLGMIYPEHRFGRTLGKHLTGLEVQNTSGGRPPLGQAYHRNLWLLLFYIPFVGPLVSLVMGLRVLSTVSNSADAQGNHDHAAGTRVLHNH